jgi:hypothetical protein
MDVTKIKVEKQNGPVSIIIDASRFPQSVAGIVWRYLKDKKKDGKAGIFNSQVYEVPLGNPSAIDEKYFLVQGVVIHQNDDPPTPYKVKLQVTQNDEVLFEEVPDKWSGQIGDKDVVITYRLQIVTT